MELKYDKLKSEFFAKICCEVRIGAIIIRDLNESISDKLWDKIDFETRSYLNEIESAGSRILRIMDLFFDMSAIQNNNKKKIDLNYILQKSYLKYKLIADAKDIDIDIKVNTSETTATSDEYITAKIFSGIIENAVKYTTRSKVEIVMEKMDNNKLCVSFSNTGIGMSNPTKFFSLFSREEKVHISDCNESDLVFPFLKMYCDLNGATIYTGDEMNIGSKFTIVFNS